MAMVNIFFKRAHVSDARWQANCVSRKIECDLSYVGAGVEMAK
jgi:hypothetical protein